MASIREKMARHPEQPAELTGTEGRENYITCKPNLKKIPASNSFPQIYDDIYVTVLD